MTPLGATKLGKPTIYYPHWFYWFPWRACVRVCVCVCVVWRESVCICVFAHVCVLIPCTGRIARNRCVFLTRLDESRTRRIYTLYHICIHLCFLIARRTSTRFWVFLSRDLRAWMLVTARKLRILTPCNSRHDLCSFHLPLPPPPSPEGKEEDSLRYVYDVDLRRRSAKDLVERHRDSPATFSRGPSNFSRDFSEITDGLSEL